MEAVRWAVPDGGTVGFLTISGISDRKHGLFGPAMDSGIGKTRSLMKQVNSFIRLNQLWPQCIKTTYTGPYSVIKETFMGFNFSPNLWPSLENAIANTLASSTASAEYLNNELKLRYNQGFDSWKIMVLAGKIDNLNPPKPMNGYIVVKAESGFSYPEVGMAPVCEPRTDIPADYSKPQVLDLPEPDHVRNVPKGDTMPVGLVATDSEGRRWQKQSSVTPFGKVFFYARVA
jgi:hypothetical protein